LCVHELLHINVQILKHKQIHGIAYSGALVFVYETQAVVPVFLVATVKHHH
jgi:hypothetical protein